MVVACALLLTLTACGDDTMRQDSRVGVEAGADLSQVDRGSGVDQAQNDTSSMSDSSGDSAATPICDPVGVTCESLPKPCPTGEVREVIASCWGSCIPIEQCSDVPAQPDCNITTGITCKKPAPSCIKGYVPTRDGSCYGPCVPITTCSCTPNGPKEQCPDPTYVCHTAGRCGPLAP
ncbi:MAG: hypothetical protein CSA65_03340 [Proteobacteria bacterium]|nr:MAG: hypothetical protein CSB49_05870 [Pseudomonadota bacterium]PIE19086.1 MAG: hypothetical protein CSA65_03340 [Pseudomonadota bacterium]